MPLDATNFAKIIIPDWQDQKIKEDEDAVRVLQHALKLVERGWTKKAYARCLFWPVPSEFFAATRFCAEGAIHRANRDLGLSSSYRAKEMLGAFTGRGGIIDYNDKHNKQAVMIAFQSAIARHTI